MLKKNCNDFRGGSGGSDEWAIHLRKAEYPEAVVLSKKEWWRIVEIAIADRGLCERDLVELINNDADPEWEGDPWAPDKA